MRAWAGPTAIATDRIEADREQRDKSLQSIAAPNQSIADA
jgi:hypothetical protein